MWTDFHLGSYFHLSGRSLSCCSRAENLDLEVHLNDQRSRRRTDCSTAVVSVLANAIFLILPLRFHSRNVFLHSLNGQKTAACLRHQIVYFMKYCEVQKKLWACGLTGLHAFASPNLRKHILYWYETEKTESESEFDGCCETISTLPGNENTSRAYMHKVKLCLFLLTYDAVIVRVSESDCAVCTTVW